MPDLMIGQVSHYTVRKCPSQNVELGTPNLRDETVSTYVRINANSEKGGLETDLTLVRTCCKADRVWGLKGRMLARKQRSKAFAAVLVLYVDGVDFCEVL